MKTIKEKIHIVAPYLLNPTNAVSVNLIGAGGTGSQLLTALARMNYALNSLGHAGLQVTVFDPDQVENANLGRQLFCGHEVGMNKAVAICNRVNRFFGTNWKGIAGKFMYENEDDRKNQFMANITLSCVDTVQSRLEIGEVLTKHSNCQRKRDSPMYWMDFGNTKDAGQVLLCSMRNIIQPISNTFETVSALPAFLSEFEALGIAETNEPSCSLAQALGRQDLFINSSLANLGASLLWSMFREGLIKYRGFYHNLKDFKTQPIRL
ncbi:PRTRC system ThiF family protein [Pedobacter fastidiosus]|uniref:PRTRC system ThiF family protein n=1 Tax=Pedobacter fastidiosus TaxID=2765361 RepID=A0ABR7KWL4_9SPHI|nr:PRTRC system ThiF family protein [Pedobacter fastidiosus]MBC6112446.1 PRTRC system ThiF family protein [Pedobacter fastidiosus]